MAFGKSKKNFNKGKKGTKKRVGDRFLKKEWWTVKAPGMFKERIFTRTPINVTQGKVLASECIKGRVFEANHADLNKDIKDKSHQKFKFIVEDAEPATKECITNFYGLETTRHFNCNIIRKWHSLIECFTDVKTKDGFLLRLFTIAFTKRQKKQLRATCYAQRSQVKQIRKIMQAEITKEVRKSTLKEVTIKL